MGNLQGESLAYIVFQKAFSRRRRNVSGGRWSLVVGRCFDAMMPKGSNEVTRLTENGHSMIPA
jgi:hypothetical protein